LKNQSLKKKMATSRPQTKKLNIKKAIKKPGQLHKDLGIPKGKKIPTSVLNKAVKRKGKVGQRARLAKTLKGLRKR